MSGLPDPFEAIGLTLKRSAAALRGAGIPFLLGGSLASWARGGPETSHDLDLMIRPRDAEAALAALEACGMRAERPPEEWLLKAWDGDVLVDLIYAPTGYEITDEVIARGEEMSVLAVTIRVMALEDVIASKLLAMHDHACDLESTLQIARSLREQVDWAHVLDRTEHSPFARAFFTLLEGLGIVERRSGRPVALRVHDGGEAHAAGVRR